jgi:hypothetical protein
MTLALSILAIALALMLGGYAVGLVLLHVNPFIETFRDLRRVARSLAMRGDR